MPAYLVRAQDAASASNVVDQSDPKAVFDLREAMEKEIRGYRHRSNLGDAKRTR